MSEVTAPIPFWHPGGDDQRQRLVHHLRCLFNVPALARSGALERLQAQHTRAQRGAE